VKKRVEIHVGQLVLHGIPAGQRQAVGEAVQRELARIAGEGGFAQGDVPRIPRIPPLRLPGKGEPSA
jgi:hypothetical protein